MDRHLRSGNLQTVSFTWAVTQQKEFEIEKTTFNIQDIFINISDFYNEIVILNANQLVVKPTDINCHTDKNILLLILRNLVENAKKIQWKGPLQYTLLATINKSTLQLRMKEKGSRPQK